MNRAAILAFADPADLVRAVAVAWAQEVACAGSAGGPFCMALSGGRIGRSLFAAMVAIAQTRHLDLGRVHFFWADERCVPPHDPESNFAAARDLLFDPLKIKAEAIHRIRGEDPPAQAAAAAAAELRTVASTTADQPVLDLVWLGMGEDGHVASLFPGETVGAMADRAVYRPVVAGKPPPQRITLGYPALCAARRVWLVVAGAGKAGALRASLAPDAATPLGRVLNQRPESQTRIYAEKALLA